MDIKKINYKSDFLVTLQSDAGWTTPFCIRFWTNVPTQCYCVCYDGKTYTRCRQDDDPTKLVVLFDDHGLGTGILKMQMAWHAKIDEFPSVIMDEVMNQMEVIVDDEGTEKQVELALEGETSPEILFNLPAYANEQQRIQNELQRQQNEAERIAAELQREQATAAAVQGAENVNAQLAGNILTVTNRQGVSTSVNTKGEQGVPGPVGPEGPQGQKGVSVTGLVKTGETEMDTLYNVTFSDGTTQAVTIPKGEKGDTGATGTTGPQGPQGPQGQTGVSITGLVKTGETETDTLYNVTFSNGTTQVVAIPKGAKGDQGPAGPQGPQGPMGDVAVITPEQQAAFTMYSEPGQHTNGPMTQKAVTDALVASSISYDNSLGYLSANNVQDAIDDVASEIKSLYLGTTMLEPGGIFNNNGQPDNSITTNSRTKYLALGTATSVIIYNYDPNRPVDGHTLYFKYMWYDSSKVFKSYQTWTSGTTVQIPSNALGGYVRIVFSRNPSATTTPSDIAQFQLYLNIYGYEGLGDKLKELEEKVSENETDIDEINNSLKSTYLDTTNLYQGGTDNNNGNTNTLSDCVRTAKLPLGAATSVIINNNKVLEDGYRLKFKFSWYNSSGTYQTYTTWQYGTEVEIPSSALGGYVIVVFTRRNSSDGSINPTTKEDIALYKLYLNIYGSMGLEDRVANLEDAAGKDYSYIDDISKGLAPKSITICTWNIGHFALGVNKNSTITGSNYTTKLAQFRDLIYNTINPRVIMLNEYSAVFGTDANSVSHKAKDVLFNDFAIKFEGIQNNYSCNALYGNTYLANIEQHSYACLPHTIINSQAQIYADNYYYVSADLYLEGRLVKLIVTHMAYGGYQDDQCNELIALLAGYDRALIIGDLNINGDSQTLIDCFAGTGYTIGNSSIPTYPTGTDKILDNIIYKGVVVSEMRAITSFGNTIQTTSLSDHYPLVATITLT